MHGILWILSNPALHYCDVMGHITSLILVLSHTHIISTPEKRIPR
jgi:hypothetical protein